MVRRIVVVAAVGTTQTLAWGSSFYLPAISTAAITAAALVGPAQVAARLVEFGALRWLHPVASARIAAAMHPVGAGILAVFGVPAIIVFALFHGAGNGLLTIAKGTLPLTIFGPVGYGLRNGILAVPARVHRRHRLSSSGF